MKRTATRLAAFAVACALGACSGGAERETTEVVITPIVGGTPATEYPEAAILGMHGPAGDFACTATLVAPKVVLTAGHCVDGMTSFDVYVGGTSQTSTSGETYDWNENGSKSVNPAHHDIGLVYLENPISISTYPTLAQAALPAGGYVVDVGRIRDGVMTSEVWQTTVSVTDGALIGFPFAYASSQVIEPGDSGGPVFAVGTHTIVAVNSGAGNGTQVLARVDLLLTWIQARIAAHDPVPQSPGNPGPSAPDPRTPPRDSMPKPETCTAEVESNDVFRKANVLAARHCGTFGSGSDVDYYRFAAPVGTTTVTLTGDGSFAIGYVVKNRCLPVLTKQTAVSVKVGGASKDLCVRVSDPSHGLGSYILTKP